MVLTDITDLTDIMVLTDITDLTDIMDLTDTTVQMETAEILMETTVGEMEIKMHLVDLVQTTMLKMVTA
jgi:hypothetical protein